MNCKEKDCTGEIVNGACNICGASCGDSATTVVSNELADDYQAWRQQADQLLNTIRQLETRQIAPDESVQIMGVPMRESALRAKAEEVLRNCAHFAVNFDERVSLIDEANRIRRTTWF
jgi:hypothetical protein